MNEELNKQLAALAAKLGTSAEHLWSVLIRQAYIDGISSLVTTLCCGLAAALVLWFFFYIRPKWKALRDPKDLFFISFEPVEYMVLTIVLGALVAVACNNFYWVISDFFNPEFYAWRQLPGVR